MALIIMSIVSGAVAFFIGGAIFNGEPVMTCIFTFVFFMAPGLYTLERIYLKLNEEK
ncbi:hypothetical protein [Clostridium fungisolvens]|uniref:Uncharacterized protein n=1 Tax=Clostridium fungisolvens TaxID=1604897 RepID=A0A6V8SP61_9CLOT|nr:hypothetical protein [Clostridium fungisolvens]GFP76653.1 hypothetical protein bsdtw1_02756 [Clostridium fungisolvens]